MVELEDRGSDVAFLDVFTSTYFAQNLITYMVSFINTVDNQGENFSDLKKDYLEVVFPSRAVPRW